MLNQVSEHFKQASADLTPLGRHWHVEQLLLTVPLTRTFARVCCGHRMTQACPGTKESHDQIWLYKLISSDLRVISTVSKQPAGGCTS